MRIALKFSGNIYNLMRRAGYHPAPRGEARPLGRPQEQAFVRRLGASDYPRFHIYLEVARETLKLNLHLDQKKPIYRGTTAHSGEYEGKLVEKEADRIKQIIKGP